MNAAMTSESSSGTRRVAIVTGAARRIGATIVEQLHRRGLNVVVHYRGSAEAADSLIHRLNQERSGSAVGVQADLADPDAPGRS
jgi:pteridine reductase